MDAIMPQAIDKEDSMNRLAPVAPRRAPLGRTGRMLSAIRWGLLLLVVASCQGDGPPTSVVSRRLNTIPAHLEFRWSDASAWPNARLPEAGDLVRIAKGVRIILDVTPPPLSGIDIEGELVADSARDFSLHADWIRVAGILRIGDATAPFTRRARIVLTGSSNGVGLAGLGTRVIAVAAGGQLHLHGPVRRSWTHLAANVAAGSSTITLRETTDWQVGEWVVVAPSGFDPFQAEPRRITAVAGRTLQLHRPLEHAHFGELQAIAGHAVDERAEIALLSRQISIFGEGPDDEGGPRSPDGYGGHIIVMADGAAYVQGVELVNMGQEGKFGHYPIHWHMTGTVNRQYIRHSAIWRSHNRCVTVHGTRELLVEENVCFDHLGHGFFLEEGAETGTRLHGNMGMLARRPAPGSRLIPTDESPATFWITNPNNSVVGNVAAGSESFGFWYALPEYPIGMSAGAHDRPTRTPLLAFRENVAHSNGQNGLHVDDGPSPDGRPTVTMYAPSDGAVVGAPAVPAYFESFRAYKNRNRGVWLRGNQHYLESAVLADNHIAATFASVESYLVNSLVVGPSSNNIGSLPVYRGFEYYDGPVGARNVTFVGFSGRGELPWSALGFNRHNAFSVSTASRSEGLRFVDSRALFLEDPNPDRDGDKAAVFEDASGSLTGVAGRWVVANTPLLTAPGCTVHLDWNARSCPGPYLKLVVEGQGTFANITPLDAVRDGTAAERFVGDGGSRSRVALSVMPGHEYRLRLGQVPVGLSLTLNEGRKGEWVLLAIEATAPPLNAGGLLGPLRQVPNRAAVVEGDGSTYAFDASAGLIYIKVSVVRPGPYQQGVVLLRL